MKIKSLFLAGLLVTSFIPCLTSCTGSAPKAPQKQVGLQLYSIRDDMGKDAKSSIDSVANIGYSFVEAANYGDGKFYGMTPAEFSQYLQSKNLVFLSSHIGRDVPTEENYEETMAWWDQAVADHKAAGVKYIVQPWMSNVGYDSLEGLKRYCDYFNAVGEKCNAAGIKFGYHNHSGEFKEIDGQVIYDFMLQNTDPSKVFFEMDVYWATKGGVVPTAYFEKYPGRFELLHIKDVKEIGASGEMNFEPIYKDAAKAGMKYAIIEQEAFDYPSFQSIRKSLEFLQNAPYVNVDYSK